MDGKIPNKKEARIDPKNRIVIEGWFCVTKGYPDLTSLFLDQAVFKKSVRVFDKRELALVGIEKHLGSMLNSKLVRGVVDLKGSLIPFFIEKEKARKLEVMLPKSL